jgi:DMSO/TMAO reductase YedYZ molybdopterin-dependent catalytic subunit
MTGRTLPPGQVRIDGFPRFGTHFHRPPPTVPPDPHLLISGAISASVRLPLADLATMPRRELVSDFHCVAGWTATNLRWGGVAFQTIYRQVIEPVLDGQPSHIVFSGLDGHESALLVEEALAEEVIVADHLGDLRLDADHGAPARLISPAQYGYMSTKHLCRIEVRTSPPRRLGAAHPVAAIALRGPLVLRHPRARVAHEERHPFLPARLLRPLYRRTIPVGIAVSADRKQALGRD